MQSFKLKREGQTFPAKKKKESDFADNQDWLIRLSQMMDIVYKLDELNQQLQSYGENICTKEQDKCLAKTCTLYRIDNKNLVPTYGLP